MTHNYVCEDATDGTHVTVTVDERLKQVRLVRGRDSIEFLNIIEEFDGHISP